MAKRTTKKTNKKKPIESYDHKGKKRANNPPVGLVTPETDPDAGQRQSYEYDPHLDPQLVWAGKAERVVRNELCESPWKLLGFKS